MLITINYYERSFSTFDKLHFGDSFVRNGFFLSTEYEAAWIEAGYKLMGSTPYNSLLFVFGLFYKQSKFCEQKVSMNKIKSIRVKFWILTVLIRLMLTTHPIEK